MNERIKELRKALGLTQSEFAKRIGASQNNIANYELGNRSPSAAAFNNICKEFAVSEEWLKTGAGEMFVAKTEDEELEAAVNRFLRKETPEFRRRLVKVLSVLSEAEWEMLERRLREIAADCAAPPAAGQERTGLDKTGQERTEADAPPANLDPLSKGVETASAVSGGGAQPAETRDEYRARRHAEVDAEIDAEFAAEDAQGEKEAG